MNDGAHGMPGGTVTAADRWLWLLIAAWLLVSLMSLFAADILSANLARYINVTVMSVFTVLHGARRYGVGGIAAYFIICVVVTNVFENLSIITGFPFGAYHHTAAMGAQIFHVPIIVGPIFAVAGYLGWMLAGMLLGEVFRGAAPASKIARPLLAALITSAWDLCVDAIGGTFNGDWVWADGGPWFGVPWLNFFGWVLTLWVSFQLFAWFLRRRPAPRDIAADAPYWTQVVVFWALIGLQFPLLAVLVPDMPLSDPAGGMWQAADLFQSMALVSVFTLLQTALLGWLLLQQARRRERANS